MVRILLHRPFVSDGHLNSLAPEVAKSSFSTCATAATNIVRIIRLYDQAFSIRRAPYLISYATYLAATIHVRIAATRASWSEAHSSLQACLTVFEQNSETNYAVRKAAVVIENLMKRMSVSVTPPTMQTGPGGLDLQSGFDGMHPAQQGLPSQPMMWSRSYMDPGLTEASVSDDFDIDAIIESFVQGQQVGTSNGAGSISQERTASDFGVGVPDDSTWLGFSGGFDDLLFGFHNTEMDSVR